MIDYTLRLTADELDELERILHLQERQDYIELLCGEKRRDRLELQRRNRVQNQLIGKLMDIRRKANEYTH